MKLLTLKARLVCGHKDGTVQLIPHGQDFVRISGHPVLVEGDPVTKVIVSCSNRGATIKPCQLTIDVQRGYSNFILIQGWKVCLDTLNGLTDGTPPGSVHYDVQHPGQYFVSEGIRHG
jgi:hypothetical protein